MGPGSSAGDYEAVDLEFQEHITEDKAAAERTLTDVLAPMLHRPAEELRTARC